MNCTLTMTQEELSELERILTNETSREAFEIQHTDRAAFRQALREQFRLDESLLEKVRACGKAALGV